MRTYQLKARIEELEQVLDIERAAFERLSHDYDRLVRERERAKAELQRMRAELDRSRPIPRRRTAA